MLEFYTAFVDSNFQMDFVEKMFKAIVKTLSSKYRIFKKPFLKLSMDEAILKNTPLKKKDLQDPEQLREFCSQQKIKVDDQASISIIKNEVFEAYVENKLIEPTFITEYQI